MNKFCVQIGLLLFLFPAAASAQQLQYQMGELMYEVMPLAEWKHVEDIPTFRGMELAIEKPYPQGVVMKRVVRWDRNLITQALRKELKEEIDRPAGRVTISRDAEGTIAFSGVGLFGRTLDLPMTVELTVKALEAGVAAIELPVAETPPLVTVLDASLRKKGIRELVTVGESDYARSPANRRHNIAQGLAKFNGHLIEPGEEFSFDQTLGHVGPSTGFLPELTIVGERTIPEFGGGLCQVSTTAYRGVWKAGYPITSRRNHSYAVRYYAPAGTDATIYPPWTDMRFLNDAKTAILIQTYHADDKAYFLYYGTKPSGRSVELVGPFNWDHKSAPPGEIRETTEIPPGTERVVSNPVPGFKSLWYRLITKADGKIMKEPFLSEYEARPYIKEVGVAAIDAPTVVAEKQEAHIIQINDHTHITIPTLTPPETDFDRTGERVRIRR